MCSLFWRLEPKTEIAKESSLRTVKCFLDINSLRQAHFNFLMSYPSHMILNSFTIPIRPETQNLTHASLMPYQNNLDAWGRIC